MLPHVIVKVVSLDNAYWLRRNAHIRRFVDNGKSEGEGRTLTSKLVERSDGDCVFTPNVCSRGHTYYGGVVLEHFSKVSSVCIIHILPVFKV